jgi:hypothetical protein
VANSLLDFVISLVRDPDAAARYAANPAQTIADAHLVDVTSADVNNLIPMVTDSLSMTTPGGSIGSAPVADHGNVCARCSRPRDPPAGHPCAHRVTTGSGLVRPRVAWTITPFHRCCRGGKFDRPRCAARG